MSTRHLKLKGSFSPEGTEKATILVREEDLHSSFRGLEGYLKFLLDECWWSASDDTAPRLKLTNVPVYTEDMTAEISLGERAEFYPSSIAIEDGDSIKEYGSGDVAELIGKSYNVEFLAGDGNVVLGFTVNKVTPPRAGTWVPGPLASDHWSALVTGVSQMLYKGVDSNSVHSINQLTKAATDLLEEQLTPVGGSRVVVESEMLSNLKCRPRTMLATSVVITDADSGEVVFQRSLGWDQVVRLVRKWNLSVNG